MAIDRDPSTSLGISVRGSDAAQAPQVWSFANQGLRGWFEGVVWRGFELDLVALETWLADGERTKRGQECPRTLILEK